MIADRVKPEDKEYSANTWHLFFKRAYLGADDVKLPNGKVITVPKSTAELDTAEFGDYFTKVQIWAQKRDIYLDDIQPA